MRPVALPAAVAVVLLFALPLPAAPAPPAAIKGTVQNVTGGHEGPLGGQAVTLKITVNSAPAGTQTATTDARGTFAFAVPADPARTYVVNVQYKGGDYDGPPLVFKAGENGKQVSLRVYEPTTDAAVVRANIHHLIVVPGEGMIQVTELVVFANTSDRTYIGGTVRPDGKRETLRFRLPDRARDLDYVEGLAACCVFAVPGGFVDTADLKPGMRQIGFNYTIPYGRGRTTVVRTLDYQTDAVEVFGSPDAQLKVTPLIAQAPVTTAEGTYSRFSGQSLPGGTAITLTLSGRPLVDAGRWTFLIPVAVGVVAAALAYPLLFRRRRPGEREPRTREELVKVIAALDNLHAAGGITDAEYRKKSARYAARLRHVSKEDEEAPPGEPDRDDEAP